MRFFFLFLILLFLLLLLTFFLLHLFAYRISSSVCSVLFLVNKVALVVSESYLSLRLGSLMHFMCFLCTSKRKRETIVGLVTKNRTELKWDLHLIEDCPVTWGESKRDTQALTPKLFTDCTHPPCDWSPSFPFLEFEFVLRVPCAHTVLYCTLLSFLSLSFFLLPSATFSSSLRSIPCGRDNLNERAGEESIKRI